MGQVTFAEWVHDYTTSSHKGPTTAARDSVVLRTHLLPTLGQIRMSAITPQPIRSVVKAMEQHVAPATVRTNYGVLKAVLNAAVEAEVIVRSPCRGIRLALDIHREHRLLSPAQFDALSSTMPASCRPLVYLGGVLGMRWSEIGGLRVRNLDFFSKTVSVELTVAEVSGRLITAGPKTRSGRRTITVSAFIMTMLSEHLTRRGVDASDADAFVFVGPGGGPPRATNFRRRVWASAVTSTGLDGLTFHGLRHSATALMVDAGLHPRVIQHRLGHASSRLSMELYAHVSDDADSRAADLIEGGFRAS